MIVDSHVHVVSRDRARYPLSPAGVGTGWYLEAPLPAEDFAAQMQRAGVERAVLVQAVGAYSWDNAYAADSAAADPARFAGVCAVDLGGADPVAALEHWCGARGMRGVRIFCISPDGSARLDSPAAAALVERAAERGWQVVVTILPDQLEALRALLERFPGVRVWLDHCGFPTVEPGLFDGSAPLFALARFDALSLKLSTHLLHSLGDREAQQRFARALAKHFGARRLIWGSDFPQTRGIDYPEMLALAREVFSVLPAADAEWPLGRNALSLWG